MDLALAHTPGEVPDGEHVVPLGRAAVVREGIDVTLVSYAKTVGHCLQAADTLVAPRHRRRGDRPAHAQAARRRDACSRSVRKTGRVVVVHEASGLCGVGAEVAAILAEQAFDALKAPVARLTGPDAPAAASWALEQAAVPQAAAIAARAMTLVGTAASLA